MRGKELMQRKRCQPEPLILAWLLRKGMELRPGKIQLRPYLALW